MSKTWKKSKPTPKPSLHPQKGLFSGKINFQHDNAKPHILETVKSKKSHAWSGAATSPTVFAKPLRRLITTYSAYWAMALRKESLKTTTSENGIYKIFRILNKPEDFFDSGICDLPKHWAKFIDAKGQYIYRIDIFWAF